MYFRLISPLILNVTIVIFARGRYLPVGDNIRLLFDIVNYDKLKQLPGVVLFVRFFKVFDCLKCDFLLKF